jgi:glycosyltransferase Alg8
MDRYFLYFLIYVLIVAIGPFVLPEKGLDPYQEHLIIFLGVVAIWRYSWLLTNIIRAKIYQKLKFAKIRAMEAAGGKELDPDHIFLLITTFRIGTDVSIEVYRAAIKEAIESGYDVTLIASVVEMSEERLVRKIFAQLDPPQRVKLVITRIKGSGKRDGLAAGFRVVANSTVDLERSVVALIDGDSIIHSGLIRKCSRLFGLKPNLGALTTDEDARLEGRDFITNVYRTWYRLRFAQRNVTMSSIALSNKVLTLTGRMSMIRASIVAKREFVETVQHDAIEHWRLGRFKFLTGDDKSSWFYLVKTGWDMLYVPDVVVDTIEEIPHRNFFVGSLMLMHRWFGNQYRTNARALRLGRKRLGTFVWYALIDQRMTMFATPYGFFIAIFGSLQWGPWIFGSYIWWVLLSRLLMAFAYRISRPDIHPGWPLFLYYNQLVGSFVKMFVWHHLYRQKWTRQKTTLKSGDAFVAWYQRTSSHLAFAVTLLVFVIIVNFLVLNIDFDDVWGFLSLSYI